MKRLMNLLRKMSSRLDRKHVLEEVRDLRQELEDYTIPQYKQAAGLITKDRFDDRFLSEFAKGYEKNIDSPYRGNWIEQTRMVAKNSASIAEMLYDLIEKSYSNDITLAGLTYSRHQLLRMVESLYFFSKYSRRMLSYALYAESALMQQNEALEDQLSPAEIQWLKDYQRDFYLVSRAFTHKPKEIQQMLEDIPDAEIDENTADAVAANVGVTKLDPMGLVAKGFHINPFYYIGIAYVEWQAARYNAAKQEKQLLEYQIQNLKQLQQDSSDPKLQQQIEYTQERVSKLNRKIAKLEEKARD